MQIKAIMVDRKGEALKIANTLLQALKMSYNVSTKLWTCSINTYISPLCTTFPFGEYRQPSIYVIWTINIPVTSQWARWRLKSPAHGCLLNRSFRRRSKKTSKLRATGLCAGNSPVTSEFLAQRVSNKENVFIWWRNHEPEGRNSRVTVTIVLQTYCGRNVPFTNARQVG